MRLWAEERKSGTHRIAADAAGDDGPGRAGKFLAAWAFVGIALALTFPIWITVNYLGDPDNGVIVASYVGSAAHGRALSSRSVPACRRQRATRWSPSS
jgi:ABC-2 type transport system permease protein